MYKFDILDITNFLEENMIFVTGATGHIGNNVVRQLLLEHQEVTCLVRSKGIALWDIPTKVVLGDIFDPLFLAQHLRPSDTLIHCAGVIDVFAKDATRSEEANVTGTKIIGEYCSQNAIYLLFISSVDAIAKTKHQTAIVEPSDFDLSKYHNHYSLVKAKGAMMIQELMDQSKLEGAIVYPSAVVGVHDYKPSLVGKELVKAMKHKVLFSVKGGYNFIDVQDVAKAITSIVREKLTGSYILAAHVWSISQMYRFVSSWQGKRKWIITVPNVIARSFLWMSKSYSKTMLDAIEDSSNYQNTKMLEAISFQPRLLEETLSDTLHFLQKTYLLSSISDHYKCK